ncbi:sulfite exporter TauE/SafE family protein [Stella sp.]|uniref:urease accessory protein UreH domain-containing protein n=1 Tax=Stella sp. TaxID=2912054 RepID=UPI0035AE13A1
MHHPGPDFQAALAAGDLLGIALAMLLAGLVGGIGHCVGMCGPFVLAQVAANLPGEGRRYGMLQRLAGAALVPYHLGRGTTYVLLGTLGGALAGRAALAAETRLLTTGLLLVAAVLMLLWAVERVVRLLPAAASGPAAGWIVARVAPFLGEPRGMRGYALGLALGFLPCGLLYGALAAAAGTGSAGGGALAMAAFLAGTTVPLVGLGWLGSFFGRRWSGAMRRIAPLLFLANALFLAWIAWRQLAF